MSTEPPLVLEPRASSKALKAVGVPFHLIPSSPMGEAPRGLRPNYSCGSLAAAEQLGALMRHAASEPSAAGNPAEQESGMLGALHHGMCSNGMGHGGMCPPNSVDTGDSCVPMHAPFGGGGSDVTSCFSQAIDHLDLPTHPPLRLNGLPFGSETQCMRATLSESYPGSHPADSQFSGASCAAAPTQYSNACPLSMLHYAGATALGPASMVQPSDPIGDSQQQV